MIIIRGNVYYSKYKSVIINIPNEAITYIKCVGKFKTCIKKNVYLLFKQIATIQFGIYCSYLFIYFLL